MRDIPPPQVPQRLEELRQKEEGCEPYQVGLQPQGA